MNHEQISALMDGELDDARAQALFASMKDDEACACWATYHLIGDALRRETFALGEFSQRFAQALAAEPTVLAPGSRPLAAQPSDGAHAHWPAHWSELVRARPWHYGMAAAAAVAAVGLVGWFGAQEFSLGPGLSTMSEQASATQARAGFASIAVNAQSSTAASRRAPVPSLDPYLLVHQEFSPTTVMQGVRPYVRTVADVTAAE
jgi:sigma-E factor negative regulatory protein RseA